MIKKMPQPNCLYTTRYCWEAEKVKTLIRLRAELSPLFTGKRNASKYAWAVVERELNVPLPLSKIIKKWNNLLQEYKAIKLSEEPKRREWPFFSMMDMYFSDQVNDPTLRLFSSTKTLGADSLDESVTLKFEDDPVISRAISMATGHSLMDISEMMRSSANQNQNQDQDRESDKASEREYEDMHPEVQMNNNNYNGGERRTSPAHQTHAMNKLINTNSAATGNGTRVGTPIGMQQQMDYDDQDDVKPPMAHTPVFMPQHHNIDQYLLSWNNFHGNMCKGFHNLQKDEKMVDVTIAAGGKIFKAHKLVLSVCSPYFQKIFLDHPSSHPILFMTDVNSNHMAGLLDFMYSGQVNVKYEDLPKFLKVAEIMQIKGLHTESTTEPDDSKFGRNAMKEPVNYNSKQQSMNNNNNSSNNNLNIPSPNQNRSTFREHIRAKNPYQDLINNNNSNNNNNNNSSTNNNLTNNNSSLNNNNNNNINNNNNNSNNTNQNLSPKYAIQQTNSSSKILDNQKYHKYFSKRKMMAQYELEMRNEKKNKLSLPTPPAAHQQDEPVALYNKSHLPPPQTEPEELTVNETNNNSSTTANNNTINSTNNNSISSSEVQNIKVEPELVHRSGSGVIATVATAAVNDDDDEDSSNSEYFLADLRKRKHSTSAIEQTLALTTKKEASQACS